MPVESGPARPRPAVGVWLDTQGQQERIVWTESDVRPITEQNQPHEYSLPIWPDVEEELQVPAVAEIVAVHKRLHEDRMRCQLSRDQ